MWKLPFFGKSKLLLAFEYGVILTQVAKEQGVDVTPEFVKKAEIMIENEFKMKTPTKLAVEMEPNILSIFELDLSK